MWSYNMPINIAAKAEYNVLKWLMITAMTNSGLLEVQ